MNTLENITIEQFTAADFGNSEPAIYLNDDDERCEMFTLYITFEWGKDIYVAQVDADFDFAEQVCFDIHSVRRDGAELDLGNPEFDELFSQVEEFSKSKTTQWLKKYEIKAA